MADEYYRPVDKDICQGDIFSGVPHLFLRPPLFALRRVDMAGGRKGMGYYEFPPPSPQAAGGPEGKPLPGGAFHFHEGEDTSARCHIARAVVLNHDCEIENEVDHRLVALVRPMAANLEPEHADVIRRNQNYNYFYLPACEVMPESYVDFRRITSLAPYFLEPSDRLTSLTREAVVAMIAQFLASLTHPD